MVPDINLQIAVVIKALRDVVAPAVDAANKLAIEQLHLSIATLGLDQQRLPLDLRRARRELQNAIQLAEEVHTAALEPQLHISVAAARATLVDPRLDEAALDGVRTELLAHVEAVVAAAVGGPSERQVARAVIVASRPQCDLARAICAPAGFDPAASELPPLDHQLQQ